MCHTTTSPILQAPLASRWYWLVDPELCAFEVLELGADGRYVHAAAATEGMLEPVPGCEELAIDVGALWAAIDALANEVAAERG